MRRLAAALEYLMRHRATSLKLTKDGRFFCAWGGRCVTVADGERSGFRVFENKLISKRLWKLTHEEAAIIIEKAHLQVQQNRLH